MTFRVALLALLSLVVPVAAPAAETYSEARLKAGFIANFLQFVVWPKNSSSLTLCSFGPDRNGDMLEHLADMAGGRGPMLGIRPVRTLSELGGCNAVFVGREEGSLLAGVVGTLAGRPVLIIADIEGGASLGATLSLVAIGGGRLGFDVNMTAAHAAGLQMNTRLLKLARRVH